MPKQGQEPTPGNRILELRVQLDWSQDKLARKARVHWSTISRIERGERDPGPRTRHKIAKALGYPEAYVFPNHKAAVA